MPPRALGMGWVLGLMLACVGPAAADPAPSDPDPVAPAALQWRLVFEALVLQKDWEKVGHIASVGELHFRNQPWWGSPGFRNQWLVWKKESARRSWTARDNNTSLWRLAEGDAAGRPTLGLRRERDGRWWVILNKPQTSEGRPVSGWNCPSSGCTLSIRDAAGVMTVHANTPVSQAEDTTWSLGWPVAATPRWTRGEWVWFVDIPGEPQPIRFDLSYADVACQQIAWSCF